MKQIRNNIALIAGCVFFNNAFAQTPMVFSPYNPGISLTGLTGSVTTGFADVLAPIFGNSSNIYYLDPQAMMRSSDDFAAGAGIGGRWLTDNLGILGAYVFGDYNHSENNNAFWFVSPGIERLGDRFDFSANLYIPVGDKKINTGTGFAGELGDPQYITFQGHSEFDTVVSTYESVGLGGDAQLSYRLPFSLARNSRVYIGGYYFAPEDADNILGGTIGAEIPINPYVSILASEAYDNQSNNTLKIGLTLALWGRSTGYNFKGDLHERMVDPIRRNLIAVAGSARTFQPIAENQMETLYSEELLTGITFFLPDTGIPNSSGNTDKQDGTFERPYIGMSQANIDAANTADNRIFYVNTGTYSPATSLTLTDDSVYGRDYYNGTPFVVSAQDNNRPLFNFVRSPINLSGDGFKAAGNDDLFDSVRISGENSGYGIFVENNTAQTASLSINNTDESHFLHGLEARNNAGGILDISLTNFYATNNTIGFNVENYGRGKIDISSSNSVYSHNNDKGLLAVEEEGSSGVIDISIFQSSFDENGQGIALISNANAPKHSINVQTKLSAFDNNINQGIFIENNGDGYIGFFADSSSFDKNKSQGVLAINNSAGWVGVIVENSSIQSNGAEGIDLMNFGDEIYASVWKSVIDGNNAAGVRIQGFNAGWTFVDLDNSNISGNGTDGLQITSFDTAEMNVDIRNDSVIEENNAAGVRIQGFNDSNPWIMINNSSISGNGAEGLNITSFDNVGMNVNISDSIIDANNAAGIRVQGFNESWTNVGFNFGFENSSVSGNANDGLNITSFDTANMFVFADNVDFKNNGRNGIYVQTNDASEATVTVVSSNFINNQSYGIFGDNTEDEPYNLYISINSFFDQNQISDTNAGDTSSSIIWDIWEP